MIIRSGINSILRSKKLCSLFFLLTVLLSLLLALGTGIYGAAAATLASFEETYRTVGRLEYIGEEYPDETVYDAAAAAAYRSLDMDSLRSVPGVISAEKKQYIRGYTEGFSRWRGNMPYKDYAVLIMTRLHPSGSELTDIRLDGEPVFEDVCMITDIITKDVTLMYYGESQTLPYFYHDRVSGKYIRTEYVNGSYVKKELTAAQLPDEYIAEAANGTLRHVYSGPVPLEDENLPRYTYNPAEGTWAKQETVISEYIGILSDYLYSGKTDKRILIRLSTGLIPFAPDEAKTYVVHGSFVDAETSNLVFEMRPFPDNNSLPFMEISSADSSQADDTVFAEYADKYRFANNYLNVYFSDDISLLEPFHQGWLVLEEGRFPAVQEEHACVIDRSLAERAGLKTGDSLPLRLLTPEETDLYQFAMTGEEEDYTITGITAENNDYTGEVYIQGKGPGDIPFFGYQLGSILFENKTARAQAEKIRELLGPQVRLTLYDQGYETNSQPLSALKTTALIMTMIASAGALAVLILFAFLYIYRQQETIETLRRLGLNSSGTAVWMLSGFLTVTLAGSMAGTLAGSLLLKQAVSLTVAGTASLYAMDTRYSEAAVGLTKAVETVMPGTLGVSLVCIVLILAAACLLGLFFLILAMNRNRPARGRQKLSVPEDTTSIRGRGVLRYGRVFFERGGSRSRAVILITFVLSLLLCGFSAMSSGWQEELETLYDNTEIAGSFVSLNGKYSSDLVIRESTVRLFNRSGLLSEMHVSNGSLHYWLEDEIPSFANTSFGQETRAAWIRKQPKLILTDSLEAAEDFFYTPAVIDWLDGYDENFLSAERPLMAEYRKTDPATGRIYMTQAIEAIVPDSWAQRQNLDKGDETEIIVSDMAVLIKIAGIYTAVSAKENIYLPLNSAYETRYLYEEHPGSEGRYSNLFENTYTTGRFRLKSARQLAAFKDFLQKNQFSQVNKPNRDRTTVLISDAAFLDTLSTLERHIAFAGMIYPVLMAFTILAGFLISWLMINGRRMDFAVMKGLGASRGKVFLIFFMEQACGAFTGILPCLLLSFFIGKPIVILMFAGAYLLGTALSIHLAGRENLMVLLAEKE